MAVRREKVVLSLETDFPRKAAEAAAALGLLNEEVNRLSRRSVGGRSATRAVADDFDEVELSARRSGKEIDKLSGRMRILTDVVTVLGPGLIPIGAIGIPAITGIASSMGFAALAGGTMIGAFQGVGDALGALNKAHLQPTQANLDAAKLAMQQISPAARDFTRELQSLGPAMKGLRDTAAANMFPGFTEGLEQMRGALPAIQRIVAAVSGELGTLGAEAGKSFASPRWAAFFEFLRNEAPQALEDMAHGTGNVAHAMAELWMAFSPLNRSFSSWLVDATEKFDRWSTGLSKTDGFHEFMAYVQSTGPQVGAALGAIANAVIQIVEAAAPLGGPVLKAITGVANAIAKIADSPIGTPIFTALAALSLYNRVLGKTGILQTSTFGAKAQGRLTGYSSALLGVTSAQERATTAAGVMARTQQERNTALKQGAGAAALLALSMSGVADKIGLAQTANLALMGGLVGGAPGAAAGGVVGLLLDVKSAGDQFATTIARMNAAAASADFSTFNAGLASAKKQLDDMKHSSGLGDLLSDWRKQVGGVLSGDISFGLGGPKSPTLAAAARAGQHEKDLASLAAQQRALGGQARVTQAALDAEARGLALTGAGAREAAGGLRAFTAAATAANAAITKQGDYDAYRSAVLDAADAIKQEGKVLKDNGEIMKGHKRAGLEERGLLRNIAAGAVQAASGMKDFDRRSKFIGRARADFIKAAQGMGMSAAAARALATQLGLIPRVTKPKVEEQGAAASAGRIKKMQAQIQTLKDKRVHMDEKGAAAATARIRALRAAIDNLRSRSINIVAHRSYTGNFGPGAAGSARGNIFYASGGMDVANRHMPELAGSGPARVWREPETKGEAYIPLADDDRRPRARSIAEETVAILGGGVRWFARGGMVRAEDGSYVPAGYYDNQVAEDGSVVGAGYYRHTSTGRRPARHPARHHPHQHHRARAHHGLDRHLKALKDALADSTAAIDREKSARDDLTSKRQSLASDVTGKFTSDLFAGGNVWAPGGGAGNSIGILKGDIAKAKAFKTSLYQLAHSGLKGDALAAIASSGDYGQAQALLGMGSAGLKQYQSLYDQRTAAANAVGQYAGMASYSGAQATANAHIASLAKDVRDLKAEIRRHNRGANHRADRAGKAAGEAVRHKAGKSRRRK